jgi:farnesyl-diphosphate farnesyltransferase
VKAILKSVSRSFYLTIQFLPRPLREPVGLAYLLARATDTIADTSAISLPHRLTTLQDLARVIAGELNFSALEDLQRAFALQQTDPHERRLIENLGSCFDWLNRLEPADRADIQDVLKTIVRGQTLDLERFTNGSSVKSLRTAAELEEYTYLVAGCVGEFWTKLGFRRLPPFANRSPNEMARLGITYGKGLQLINVLRDRNADLKSGRDYLPADELATESPERTISRWLGEAEEQITAGIDYCCGVTNWRVRFATVLPALIGARTIALLRAGGNSGERIKVSRPEVWRIVRRAFTASSSPLALRAFFDRLIIPPR